MSGASPARPPGWPEPRIGDREREGAVWALGEHFAVGRLTQDEYDERAGRAWQAKTHSELAPLFGDLPQPHGRPARVPAAAPAPPPRQPARRLVWWQWLLGLVLALFVLGAVIEEPVLIVALVVALVLLRGARRKRRHPHRPHR